VKEAGAILRGEAKPHRVTRSADLIATDIRALRAHFDLSQVKFAALLGISVDTLQNWEQGRRQPDGPARVLLKVAAKHPDALLSVAERPARRRARRVAA
jgi:putative transcriptional regulator